MKSVRQEPGSSAAIAGRLQTAACVSVTAIGFIRHRKRNSGAGEAGRVIMRAAQAETEEAIIYIYYIYKPSIIYN